MGAWDTGPFDNDDAADLIASGNLSWRRIQKEFDDVLHAHGYLDAPDASEAVAGIALVAAKLGGKGILPADISGLPAKLGPMPEKLPGLALKALLRIRGKDSELNELWSESEEFNEWVKTLDDIEAVLMRAV